MHGEHERQRRIGGQHQPHQGDQQKTVLDRQFAAAVARLAPQQRPADPGKQHAACPDVGEWRRLVHQRKTQRHSKRGGKTHERPRQHQKSAIEAGDDGVRIFLDEHGAKCPPESLGGKPPQTGAAPQARKRQELPGKKNAQPWEPIGRKRWRSLDLQRWFRERGATEKRFSASPARRTYRTGRWSARPGSGRHASCPAHSPPGCWICG